MSEDSTQKPNRREFIKLLAKGTAGKLASGPVAGGLESFAQAVDNPPQKMADNPVEVKAQFEGDTEGQSLARALIDIETPSINNLDRRKEIFSQLVGKDTLQKIAERSSLDWLVIDNSNTPEKYLIRIIDVRTIPKEALPEKQKQRPQLMYFKERAAQREYAVELKGDIPEVWKKALSAADSTEQIGPNGETLTVLQPTALAKLFAEVSDNQGPEQILGTRFDLNTDVFFSTTDENIDLAKIAESQELIPLIDMKNFEIIPESEPDVNPNVVPIMDQATPPKTDIDIQTFNIPLPTRGNLRGGTGFNSMYTHIDIGLSQERGLNGAWAFISLDTRTDRNIAFDIEVFNGRTQASIGAQAHAQVNFRDISPRCVDEIGWEQQYTELTLNALATSVMARGLGNTYNPDLNQRA